MCSSAGGGERERANFSPHDGPGKVLVALGAEEDVGGAAGYVPEHEVAVDVFQGVVEAGLGAGGEAVYEGAELRGGRQRLCRMSVAGRGGYEAAGLAGMRKLEYDLVVFQGQYRLENKKAGLKRKGQGTKGVFKMASTWFAHSWLLLATAVCVEFDSSGA